ncbi:amino acid transporter heavy chain SLC3A2-like [Passerculus sandwichensis]
MAAHGGNPEKDGGVENVPGAEKNTTPVPGIPLSRGANHRLQNAPSGVLPRPVRPGALPVPPCLVPFDPPGAGASAAPRAWLGGRGYRKVGVGFAEYKRLRRAPHASHEDSPKMDPESPPRELELSALEAEKEPMAAAAEPDPEPASPPQAPPPHRDPCPAPGAEKNGLVMKIPPEEEEEAALGGSGVSGSPKFTGLGKEELLREAGTPLWARARLVLLVLFWGGWLGMLGAAAAIVAQAPRCQPLPAKAWWELGALYRAPPKAFGGDLKGVEKRLGYLKEKLQVGGLILGPLAPQKRPEDPIPPLRELDPALGSPQDLSALLQAAKDKGLKVILDLTPNPGGDQIWGDAAKDPQVQQQVQDALGHWLKEEIAGVFLDGIEELPPSVVAEWRNLTEEKPSPSGVTRVLVGGTHLQDPQLVPPVPGGLRLLLGPFLQPLVPQPELESPEGALRNLLSFLSSNSSIGGLGWSESLLSFLSSNSSIGGLGWSVGSPWRSWAPPELRLPQLLLLWGLPGTPVLSYGDELGLARPPQTQQFWGAPGGSLGGSRN